MEMKTKQFIQLLLTGTILMMLALASCSKDDDLPIDENYDGPDLELSYTKATLSADKGELEIEATAGSESYSVESGSKSIVSASVSGNKIKLKAEKVGSAKVTVTDKKSGDKKTIEVEVMSGKDFYSAILGVGIWRLIDGVYSDDGGGIYRPIPDGIGFFYLYLFENNYKSLHKITEGSSYGADNKYELTGNKITYPDLKDAYTTIYYVEKDKVLHLIDVFDNGGFIQKVEFIMDDGRG